MKSDEALADLIDVVVEVLEDDAHDHCGGEACPGNTRPHHEGQARAILDAVLPVARRRWFFEAFAEPVKPDQPGADKRDTLVALLAERDRQTLWLGRQQLTEELVAHVGKHDQAAEVGLELAVRIIRGEDL